jgi:hypothetical protein
MLRQRAAPLIAKHRLTGDQRPFRQAAKAVEPEVVQPTLF